MRFTGEDGGARRDMWGVELPGGESKEVGLAGLDEREEEVALVAPERNGLGRTRPVLEVRWWPPTGRDRLGWAR